MRLRLPVTKVRLTACAPTRESALFITPIAKLDGRDGEGPGSAPYCVRPTIAASAAATTPIQDPPRVATRELDQEGSGERSNDEEQDRQRRERSGAKRALRGLIAGLGGVSAHERHVDAIGDHAIGVDEACDHRESGGQPLRASSLGSPRTRRRSTRHRWRSDRSAGVGFMSSSAMIALHRSRDPQSANMRCRISKAPSWPGSSRLSSAMVRMKRSKCARERSFRQSKLGVHRRKPYSVMPRERASSEAAAQPGLPLARE